MILEVTRHSGKCGHCYTEVPIQANVCVGCGAKCGFSNGRNRQAHYDAFKMQYFFGRFIFFTCAILLAAMYIFRDTEIAKSDFGALSIVCVVGLFASGKLFLTGWQQVTIAKKGELNWWR